MQKIQPIEDRISGQVEAFSLTELSVELAIKESPSSANYRDITVDLPVLKQAITEIDASLLNSNELENYLLDKIPFHIEITQQGSEVRNLKINFRENNNLIPNDEDMDLCNFCHYFAMRKTKTISLYCC